MLGLRRIEELLPLTAFFSLRERIFARLGDPNRKAQFDAIRAQRKRDRLFVIGAAPSLSALKLDQLVGEDYFLVNMAEHLDWAKGKRHPYYLAADTGVVQKYEDARPSLDAQYFFYAEKLRERLAPAFVAKAKPFFFLPAKGGIRKRGLLEKPWISVAAGHTILLTAVQIGWALGYREIYVLGCDLDYSGPDPYAYRTTDIERKRAARDNRLMLERANEEFAILQAAIAEHGGSLTNAGVGGRLDSLPRVNFADLFGAAT